MSAFLSCSRPVVIALLLLAPLTGLVALEEGGVRVTTGLELHDGSGRLVVTFTPLGEEPWHLYGLELPEGAVLGQATTVTIDEGGWLTATGPATTDQETHLLTVPGFKPLPVFDAGPVVVQVPVRISQAGAAAGPTVVRVSYMACTEELCQQPVHEAPISLPPPGEPSAPPPVDVATDPVQAPPPQAGEPPALQLRALTATSLPPRGPGPAELDWYHVATAGELRAALDQAATDGTAAFLDFTGISCKNCQTNARVVFPQPAVRQALAGLERLEIDTDRHPELGALQARVFGTSARPLYVRVDPDGSIERWSAALVGPTATADVEERFVAFLGGAAGADLDVLGMPLWQLLLVAVFGGLFTLLMPCTYPMIPLTVNFFVHQAEGGRRLLPLALAYGGGIVAFFVGLGWLVGFLFDANITNLAGSPWTNLIIAIALILLGLSLLGLVRLLLPSGMQQAAGRLLGASGYVGALLMGLTFVVTAFTCTAPVAGGLLIGAVRTGDWLRTVLGMGTYGLVLAVPFVLLALSPRLLQRLPRSGAWMEEFKVAGGLVEIASALAFLTVSDSAWGWGLFDRGVVFGLWTLIALAIAAYLAGLLARGAREIGWGPGRILAVLAFVAVATFFGYGVAGGHLGQVEGWLAGR